MPIAIEVYSDVICPWCFVGKRRLEAALAQLGDDAREVGVTWRPFELNPDMPREGMDRAAYRAAKFGSAERSRELDARLRAVGAAAGLDFAFDRIGRTPNTFEAHRLISIDSCRRRRLSPCQPEMTKSAWLSGVPASTVANSIAAAAPVPSAS